MGANIAQIYCDTTRDVTWTQSALDELVARKTQYPRYFAGLYLLPSKAKTVRGRHAPCELHDEEGCSPSAQERRMKVNDAIQNKVAREAPYFCSCRLGSSSHKETYLQRSSSTSAIIGTTVYIGKSDTNPHHHAYSQNLATNYARNVVRNNDATQTPGDLVILITRSHIQK